MSDPDKVVLKIRGLKESLFMIYQVWACLTYIQQWVANVALPIFNRSIICGISLR
jgi:hypothetical protein